MTIVNEKPPEVKRNPLGHQSENIGSVLFLKTPPESNLRYAMCSLRFIGLIAICQIPVCTIGFCCQSIMPVDFWKEETPTATCANGSRLRLHEEDGQNPLRGNMSRLHRIPAPGRGRLYWILLCKSRRVAASHDSQVKTIAT